MDGVGTGEGAKAARRRVIVTRPRRDAEGFARMLAEAGYEPILAPVMEIEPVPGPAPDLAQMQAVAFTSGNGVRAYLERGGSTDSPAFAVGPASADLCREAGFAQVHEAGGDVDKLADLILETCDPADGSVFHGAAETVAGDLVGRLQSAGHPATRETLYRTKTATVLPQAFADALAEADDHFTGVTLLSPRTARTVADLVAKAGLTERLKAVDAFCLSEAVASAARVLPWRTVWVAPDPNTASILACLDVRTTAP